MNRIKTGIKSAMVITCVLLLGLFTPIQAEWFLDFENGFALSGYNDVQIPREIGTRFSLTEDLQAGSSYFFRVRLGYRLNSRHMFSIFAAPLSLDASGKINSPLRFFEEEFAANIPLEARYTFNSYRFTYRYDFVRNKKWRVGAGLTAKIRDAAIRVEGNGKSEEKANVGFVPLINFWIQWRFHEKWGFLLEGDAAAASQGRAEDVLLAVQYKWTDGLTLKAGYRIIEGGADVEEVYNFALIHFFVAGITVRF